MTRKPLEYLSKALFTQAHPQLFIFWNRFAFPGAWPGEEAQALFCSWIPLTYSPAMWPGQPLWVQGPGPRRCRPLTSNTASLSLYSLPPPSCRGLFLEGWVVGGGGGEISLLFMSHSPKYFVSNSVLLFSGKLRSLKLQSYEKWLFPFCFLLPTLSLSRMTSVSIKHLKVGWSRGYGGRKESVRKH